MDRRRFFFALTAGLTFASLVTITPTWADHRSVHDEYRERIRELDCWRRDALEELRCDFERDRGRLERALREARRACRHGRDERIDRLEHELADLHDWYHEARDEVHDTYRCKRRDIDAWYRSSKRHAERYGRLPARGEFRPHSSWPPHVTWDRR